MYFHISHRYLKWNIIRLLWIAFYYYDGKNKMNRLNVYTADHIGKLPKDIIKYIIAFIGNIRLDHKNKLSCIVLEGK